MVKEVYSYLEKFLNDILLMIMEFILEQMLLLILLPSQDFTFCFIMEIEIWYQ